MLTFSYIFSDASFQICADLNLEFRAKQAKQTACFVGTELCVYCVGFAYILQYTEEKTDVDSLN